jgi:hypothetical protein
VPDTEYITLSFPVWIVGNHLYIKLGKEAFIRGKFEGEEISYPTPLQVYKTLESAQEMSGQEG